MAIAFDNADALFSSGSSYSHAYTCTGTDRALGFGSTNPNGTTITGATYGGVAMVLGASTPALSAFYLTKAGTEPASGSNTLTVTLAASDNISWAPISFNGVASLRDCQIQTLASRTDPQVTVTTVAGDMVVDFCVTVSDPTPDIQDVKCSLTDWVFSVLDYRSGIYTAISTSTLMRYFAALGNCAIVAMSFVPETGGGTTDGVLATAGTGAATFVGKAVSSSPLACAGIGTASFVGQGLTSGVFGASGAGVATFIAAREYHVAKTGNDANNGFSLATAKLTVAAGIAVAVVPGDSLLIHVGDYAEQFTYGDLPSGTAGNIITIKAFANDVVRLNPANGVTNYILALHANQYLTIKNLILDGIGLTDLVNTTDLLVAVNCSNVTIQDNTFVNSTGNGIEIGACQSISLLNNLISEVGRLNSNQYHGLYINASSPFGDGPCTDILVDGGYYHDIAGFGIHVFSGVGSLDRVIVRNTRIYHIGFLGGVQNPVTSISGLLLTDGDSQQAYNNRIYDCLGKGLTSSFGAGSTNIQIYNNTVYNNGNFDGQPGIVIGAVCVDGILRNNIAFGNAFDIDDIGTGTINDHNITSDPSFTNPGAGDFTLQSGSVAIGAGLDLTSLGIAELDIDAAGNARPSGSAWDAGAFQFISGAGIFNSSGAADAFIVGRGLASSALATTGNGVATFVGEALVAGSGVLACAGSGVATFVGSSLASSPLTSNGIGAATFTSASLAAAILNAIGVGVADFVGDIAGLTSGVITAAGQGAALFIGNAVSSGVLNITGIGLAVFIGATVASLTDYFRRYLNDVQDITAAGGPVDPNVETLSPTDLEEYIRRYINDIRS